MDVQVLFAGARLDGAASLIKPAILYADAVTVFSPAASALNAIGRFASTPGERERALLMLEVMDQIPQLRSSIDVDPAVFDQLRGFLRVDPELVAAIAESTGGADEVAAFYDQLHALGPIWEEQFPEALRQIQETLQADELLQAVDAGVVSVGEVSSAADHDIVAKTVNAAFGASNGDDFADEMLLGFVSRIIQILGDDDAFPLIDADTSGLVGALEREFSLTAAPLSMQHAAEVASASRIMGYLPSFPELPMHEVLDLRRELAVPVLRFRTEWASVSKQFRSRVFDASFEAEVDEAWRLRVEPALREIRESLAEHGLLRETQSVVLGDPRRLLLEVGGVVALAHADAGVLSSLMTTAIAAALPTVDMVGRSLGRTIEARRQIQKHPFYFVHRLASASARHQR